MFVYWLNRPIHIQQNCQGYIGVTVNPRERLGAHRRGDTNRHVSNAFNCYTDIQMTILFEGTEEECLALETKLRPEDKIGWNITKGGGLAPDCTGRTHTQETKDKISAGNKGKLLGRKSHFKGLTDRFSDETKAKIGSYHKGKTISQAHIDSMRPKLSGGNSSVAKEITLVHKDDPTNPRTFDCIKTASKELGIGYSALRTTIRDRRTTYNRKGWKVLYKQNTNLGVR